MVPLVVINLYWSALFGHSGVGTRDSPGLSGYAGSSELASKLFRKYFGVWGQENVGSYVVSCSRDLSVSKNNPSWASEGPWESPVPVRVSRCGQAWRHHHGGRGGELADARFAGLPTAGRRTQPLATPGPGLAAALFCCFSCCQRIFLGTNDSAT